MKIGLIGLPQAGKKVLFELLTGHKLSENEIISNKPVKAMAEIKDPRFDRLVEIYNPKKQTRARIDIEILPKLEKDSVAKGDIFSDIKELDAICHVVRAFKDESVYHIEGSVDPKRDIDFVNSEIILHDLLFIEKRLENIEKKMKRLKDEAGVREKELLLKLKAHLDKELPLWLLDMTADEKKLISSYPFVTNKTMIIALNVSEEDMAGTDTEQALKAECAAAGIELMRVSAKVEFEIAKLESEDERKEFLKEIGIEEPAINVLARLCIKALKLISFFTAGPKELRQWTLKAGSTAAQAAGTIHTDMQKGFIRAEVIKYADIESLGSEAKVKESGKFYLKGKDYIVTDGDLLGIRFNV